MLSLSPKALEEKQEAHAKTVITLTQDWEDRHIRGEKQPIIDFLFIYFSFKFSRLLQYSAGHETLLEQVPRDLPDFLRQKHSFRSQKGWPMARYYQERPDGLYEMNHELLPIKRLPALRWTAKLLEYGLKKNTPKFSCFGLHEWCMVYKTEDIRHEQLPFRLSQADINDYVSSQEPDCSHYDAFRFFTPDAVPMNKNQLTRDEQEHFDQAGCIHVNMDLYKWCYKLYPWVSSDLLLDCFKLAISARELDMAASPYDCSQYGLEPVKVETDEGRVDFVLRQKQLSQEAQVLRASLLNEYQKIIKACEEQTLCNYDNVLKF